MKLFYFLSCYASILRSQIGYTALGRKHVCRLTKNVFPLTPAQLSITLTLKHNNVFELKMLSFFEKMYRYRVKLLSWGLW